MNTDPIADYLTRIRNASSSQHAQTIMPYSKLKEAVSKVLKQQQFIENYEVKTDGKFKQLVVSLKPWIKESLTLKRVSKPGQRIYLGYKDIKRVRNGLGVQVISTSKGVMTGDDARKQKLGGELICEIY